MKAASYVPGMEPGAHRRNALVLLFYLFVGFVLLGSLVRELLRVELSLLLGPGRGGGG